MMDSEHSVCFVTTPDAKTADDLAAGLVEGRLAACVNILPGMRSVYRWQGKTEKSEEHLLLVKTRTGLLPEITEFVKKNHPYDLPETIALPVIDGSAGYLDWIGANTRTVGSR